MKKADAVIRLRGFVLLGLSALSGCGQTDPVEGFANWAHHFQGGVIAGPILPAPGFDQPYPKVGRVPRKSVVFPTAQARTALSGKLIEQRNFAQYVAARDGALTLAPEPPSPSSRAVSHAGSSGQMASSTMPVAAAPTASVPPETSRKRGLQPVSDPDATRPADRGATDLPQVTFFAPPEITRKQLPPIPSMPPPPPYFSGFNIPYTPVFIPPPVPHLTFQDPEGDLIQFPLASDVYEPKEEGAIKRLAGRYRPGRIVTVIGYGDVVSFSPADQAAALNLGILRARRVGDVLVAKGLPARDIRLASIPLGHGVRITFAGGP